MNDLSIIPETEALPVLIDRAVNALSSAKTSAEVLEARDLASTAYHAAKHAGRIARAKAAHDTLLAHVHRAQADALLIEAKAKIRLADEYDAAQERGEVSKQGAHVAGDNMRTQDLGLRRDAIHEARKLRDAEAETPGLAARALDAMIERGEEPTKAALRREMAPQKPQKVMNPKALWVWGRLKDFERDGVLDVHPASLTAEMTDAMRADVQRLAPLVAAFIAELETA